MFNRIAFCMLYAVLVNSELNGKVLTTSINMSRVHLANLTSGKDMVNRARYELIFRRHQLEKELPVKQSKASLKKESSNGEVAKSASKLQLDWTIMAPVKAQIKHWFGQGDGKLSRGVVYEILSDLSVYAPIDGEVVFAGPVKEFGYVVMIEKDYKNLVLLSGLGFLKVRHGEVVYRGQPIGTVVKGDSLYLEFRNAGVSVDPKAVLVAG